MVLVTWISVTGVLAGIDFYTTPRPPEEILPQPTAGAPPLPRAFDDLAVRAMGLAAAELKSDPPKSLRLDIEGTQVGPRVVVKATGNRVLTLTAEPGEKRVTKSSTPAAPSPPLISAERLRIHNLLLDLHSGHILGLPGRLLDILGGSAFVFLAGSGVWMYIDMLRLRRRDGDKALFWSQPAAGLNRTLHRWLSTIGIVLLPWLVITGTLTAIAHLVDPSSEPKFTMERPAKPLPTQDLTATVVRVAQAAQAARGDAPFSTVHMVLQTQRGRTVAELSFDGDARTTRQYDPASGRIIPVQSTQARYLNSKPGILLLALHAGVFFGRFGQTVMLLTTFAMLTMAVTGILIFIDQWRRRAKQGKRQIFWP